MRETDADFTAYVRAWQLPLTQAAYVVCGDAGSAEWAVRQAFTGLALRWDHVRRDDPSAYVRRLLYRAVLDSVPSRMPPARTTRPAGPGSLHDSGVSGAAPHGTRAGSAVWRLSPRQRAVALLRCLDQRTVADTADILSVDETAVRRELRAALEGLVPPSGSFASSASAGSPAAPSTAATSTAGVVARLLRAEFAGVREVEHAGPAWEAARRRRARLRRRALAAVAAAALVVAGVAVVAESRTGTTRPEARSLTPVPSLPMLWRMSSDGIAYVVAPTAGTEQSTQPLDSGLPSLIDPELATHWASRAGFGRPSLFADAVYLQRVSPGHWEPVLVWHNGEQLVVDTLRLTDIRTRSGEVLPPLGVRAFSSDRTAIAFPQPGRVVVLRTATGAVESIPVPSPWLERVWWYGGWLIAGDASTTWQISGIPDYRATRLPDAYGLLEYRSENGIPVLDDHVPYQHPRLVGWPLTRPYGATVSSSGRVASAFTLDGVAGRGIAGTRPKQAIVATDGSGRLRMLVLGEERPRLTGCCPVLGWTVDSDVVYADSGPQGTWVMAWNLETGQVHRLTQWLTSVAVPPAMALGVRFTAG